MAKRRFLCLLLLIAFLFSAIGEASALSVSLNKRCVTLGTVAGVNDSITLTAKIKPASAIQTVLWSSTNPLVADVSEEGVVRAHTFGKTTVKAKVGKKTASCKVTVKQLPVTKVKLSKSKLTLYDNREGKALTVTITPKNADDTGCTWSSTNEAVATVSQDGFVTPTGVGKAYIICRSNANPKKYAKCKVTVKGVVAKSVTLNTNSLYLNVGKSDSLSATIYPTDTTNKTLKWTSSNTKVATVDANGKVTGVLPGTAQITCKTVSGSCTAKCTVTVGYQGVTIRALLIGNTAYSGSELPGSFYDMVTFESICKNSSFAGVSFSKIVKYTDQTASQIRSDITDLANWGIDDNDITYFFYSGHGGCPGNDTSIVGVDYSSVTMTELRNMFDKIPGTIVIVLDSCFSGGLIDVLPKAAYALASGTVNDYAQNVIATFSGATLMTKSSATNAVSTTNKYKVLVACANNESSWVYSSTSKYIKQGSFFTHYLGFAAGSATNTSGVAEVFEMKGDSNSNGYLTLSEAYQYTKTNVQKKLEPYGYVQTVMSYPTSGINIMFARVS